MTAQVFAFVMALMTHPADAADTVPDALRPPPFVLKLCSPCVDSTCYRVCTNSLLAPHPARR